MRYLFVICCIINICNAAQIKDPAVVVGPYNTTAVVGSNVNLVCKIENRQGDVQFVKDGNMLGYDRDIPNYVRYEFLYTTTKDYYILKIRDVEASDSGWYQCLLSQQHSDNIVGVKAYFTVVATKSAATFVANDNLFESRSPSAFATHHNDIERIIERYIHKDAAKIPMDMSNITSNISTFGSQHDKVTTTINVTLNANKRNGIKSPVMTTENPNDNYDIQPTENNLCNEKQTTIRHKIDTGVQKSCCTQKEVIALIMLTACTVYIVSVATYPFFLVVDCILQRARSRIRRTREGNSIEFSAIV